MKSYKELDVWKAAIDLVDEIYLITRSFPESETYGLASQMQRAAVAIPSNIAEGYSRNHRKEYVQFLGVAYSSAAELDTQLIIASRQYSEIDYTKANVLLERVLKMFYVLTNKLKYTTVP